MLKFLLVGWACIGTGLDQKCVKLASEVIHENVEDCSQYYTVIRDDLQSRDTTITLNFNCVQTGLLEDLL
jgi:hypothetical protein